MEDKMEKEITARDLPVRLTPQEVEERTSQLLEALAKIDQLTDEKKQVAADYKSRIDELTKKAHQYRRAVEKREEYRLINCDVVKEFSSLTVSIIRQDTGEIVEERAMTDFERQHNLKLVKGEKEDGAPEAS
jgi:uncharacterized coiled-coil DUF342 family protein